MTTEWPPPAAAESPALLVRVDVNDMPNAKPFSAYLEALDTVSVVTGWTPCVGTLNGVEREFHGLGVPGKVYEPASIRVATPDQWQNASEKPEFVRTVLQHLGAGPEHFMAFAQVLSGQDIAMGGTVTEEGEGYVTPIDWAYYNLAFAMNVKTESPSGNVTDALADFAELNSAAEVINATKWEGSGKDKALGKFILLMNYLIHIRAPMHAEFGATLVAYAALIKAAREQLDGIMAQAHTAMRRLDAAEGDLVKTLAALLTMAGFLPGLPYAISFGIQAASMVVSEIEKQAEKKETPVKITIPDNRCHTCVDILRWYLDEARTTCEVLADGVAKLTKRLHELLDEVITTATQKAEFPEGLNALPN
ncbi:hypothetical protein ACIOD2_41030 [Amycolatopsis sp. NPDC088138]|uniref:hypothetical protein n=1 Tax=Amycolatopsis sp. NPDC088138 TaxID=3363938 RepID=UPI0038170977